MIYTPETPVALVLNGSTEAVLMATPHDLADLLAGFCLSEGIVEDINQIKDLSVTDHGAKGIEVAAWIPTDLAAKLDARRRSRVGPVGCGLCGIEGLEDATRTLPPVKPIAFSSGLIPDLFAKLSEKQMLGRQYGGMHAAGFWSPHHDMIVREDVGRHNALDKLIGAIKGHASQGVIVMTSRLSLDLVQKSAAIGCPVLIGAAPPTDRAVALAKDTGMTLITGVREPKTHTEPKAKTYAA